MASTEFSFTRGWTKGADGPLAVLVYNGAGFRMWVTTDNVMPTVDKYKAPAFDLHPITLAAGEQLWLTADVAPSIGSIHTGEV